MSRAAGESTKHSLQIPGGRYQELGNRALARLFVLSLMVVLVGLPLPGQAQKGKKPSPPAISLVNVAPESHLAIAPLKNILDASALRKPIPAGEYSLDYARRVLIPAMGGSAAINGAGSDGYPDIYVVVPGSKNHLFRNLKNGTFADVTDKSGVSGTGADLAAAFADYDHSGHASLFVAGLDGVRLYHPNADGTFSDITEKAGLQGKSGELATSVLLFDADGDGFFDLLVTIYTDLNTAPAKASFVFPNDFASAVSHLYRNQGDGTFREITAAAGLSENPGRTRKALAVDFRHSGRLDLLLLRDNKPPALYANQGQGKFEDQTWAAGRENWKYAYVDAQSADFGHDGKPDLALWSTIGDEVLVNQGDGTFEQESSLPVLFAANRVFGFHGAVVDFNGDGDDDLLTVDNRGQWRCIANHHGKFAEVPLNVHPADGKGKMDKSAGTAPPELSSLMPVRLRKDGPIVLLGVQMDGQVIALEIRAKARSTSASHSR